MKKKNTFTLRLSERQLETLREMAMREKRTVSAIIRNLIDDTQKKQQVCKTGNENGVFGSVSRS